MIKFISILFKLKFVFSVDGVLIDFLYILFFAFSDLSSPCVSQGLVFCLVFFI